MTRKVSVICANLAVILAIFFRQPLLFLLAAFFVVAAIVSYLTHKDAEKR